MFGYEYFEKDEDAQEGLSMLLVAPEVASEYIRSKEYQEFVKELKQRYEERLREK